MRRECLKDKILEPSIGNGQLKGIPEVYLGNDGVNSLFWYLQVQKDNRYYILLRQYLQRVADNTDFKVWYFGHFHEDTEVEDMFYCLYDDIVVL